MPDAPAEPPPKATDPSPNPEAAPAGPPASAASAVPAEPWLEVTADRYFASWMTQHQVSIAFTTYQAGKLLFLGVNPQGTLSVFERTFNRCMGLWADSGPSGTLWLSSLYQMWRLENALDRGEQYQGYDRLYVPRIGYTTGDLDGHDLAVESGGRVVFVSTTFSCLATLSQTRSFVPLWKPPFISKFAPGDRCHLNGLALENGRAAYVTSCSRADVPDGWRDRRRDGGCIMDVRTNEMVVNTGLSMPHSPRVFGKELYLHNSGQGYFGKVNRSSGTFEPITFCPGYLRGLAFVGNNAVVGLSKPRDRSFSGLALDGELEKRQASAQCGLQVIDLKTGDVQHWVRIEGSVTELYDVVVLPGVRRPMALGFKNDEIQRMVGMEPAGRL